MARAAALSTTGDACLGGDDCLDGDDAPLLLLLLLLLLPSLLLLLLLRSLLRWRWLSNKFKSVSREGRLRGEDLVGEEAVGTFAVAVDTTCRSSGGCGCVGDSWPLLWFLDIADRPRRFCGELGSDRCRGGGEARTGLCSPSPFPSSTMVLGAAGLSVGVFLALALVLTSM